MYIAHNCPECSGVVVYYFDTPHVCNICGRVEDAETFDRYLQYEDLERHLNYLIEDIFPTKTIDNLENTIALSYSWHLRGHPEDRDYCLKEILNYKKILEETYGVCYCDFDYVTRKLERWKDLAERSKKEHIQKSNIDSLEATFATLIPLLKS